MKNITNYASEDALLVLVGNKADNNRKVQVTEADSFVQKNNFDNFFEVSATTNYNIDELLKYTLFTLIEMYTDSKSHRNMHSSKGSKESDVGSIVSVSLRDSITSIQKKEIEPKIKERPHNCCGC